MFQHELSVNLISFLTKADTQKYNLTKINTTEFILDAAHQKEDLIHRFLVLYFTKLFI